MKMKNDLSYTIMEELSSIIIESEGQKQIIVVEGGKDKSFYSYLFDFELTEVHYYYPYNPDDSKLRVIELVKANAKFADIIGIIDTDYDLIEECKENHPKLFYTDYHDLETFVIMSKSLSKILSSREIELADIRRIKNFPDQIDINGSKDEILRQLLFEKSFILGKLRLLNLRNCWNLPFKRLLKEDWKYDYYKKLGFENLNMCIHYLLTQRNMKTSNPTTTTQIILKIFQELDLTSEPNYPHLCHGKDMFKILIFYLNTYLRLGRKREVDVDNLYDSYEKPFFGETKLFNDVHAYING